MAHDDKYVYKEMAKINKFNQQVFSVVKATICPFFPWTYALFLPKNFVHMGFLNLCKYLMFLTVTN
jgi:hypothetical protein